MSRTIEQLLTEAYQIKEATIQGENTALRVGGLFVDLVDYLSTIHGSDVTLSPLLNALNDPSLVNPLDNQILQYDLTSDRWSFSSSINELNTSIQNLSSTVNGNYTEYQRAIETIERQFQSFDDSFLPLTGGTLTGLLIAAAGIKVLGSLQIGNNFSSGLLGTGGIFREEANGTTYLEADKLYIRMKAYFDTVEIRRYIHSGGNRIATPAGIKCARVDALDANGNVTLDSSLVVKYRCFFRGSDGDITVTNDFQIGDQAYCRITNVSSSDSMYMHQFWRLVVGKDSEVNADNEHYIDLSNQVTETIDGIEYAGFQDDSDAPVAEDDIIQLGNVNDDTRRGAIIEYVSGADSPSYKVYQDLGNPGTATTIVEKRDNQYSMLNKEFVSLGYNSSTGRAYLDGFGDLHLGDRNDSTYIKYNASTKELDIKANVIFQSPDDPQQDITLDQFAGLIVGDIDNLQSQLDGEVDSWFYDYMPVADDGHGAPANRIPLTNVDPYKTWYEADNGGTAQEVTTERTKHLGDTFYDNSSGYAFRFSLNEATQNFEWVEIQDSAVITALAKAAKAQDTADSKRRTFVSQPTATVHDDGTYVEYDVGDLWTMVTFPAGTTVTDESQHEYYRELLKCKTAKPIRNGQGAIIDGSFSINDWELATKYTDDYKVNRLLTKYGQILNISADEEDVGTALGYLEKVLSTEKTSIDGGLILTNIIYMKGTESTPVVHSGISGLYQQAATGTGYKGHGTAAWYGGGVYNGVPIDKEVSGSSGQYADYAKILFRFDGSGYLAGGNISWTDAGDLTVQGNIINATSYIDTPTIKLDGTDITTALNTVLGMFEIKTINGVEFVHVKNNRSFYSDGDISALGAASGGGGGDIGSLSDLNDVSINNPSNGQMLVYDSQSSHWLNQTVNLVTSLANLTDVNIGSQTNGQALLWDSSTSKWVAGDVSVNRINGIVKGGTCILGGTHTGWINIARFDLNQYGNNDAQAFDLYVRRQYNSPESESFTCNISIGWNTGNIKVLNRVADHAIVDYIRVADSGNYRYIQLYVNPTYSTYGNYTSFSIIGATGYWDSLDEVASGTYTEVCSCVLAAESGVAYQATDNNFITRTNEFNFVPSGFNLDIYINYRTVGGQNGSIGKYIFCDGAGNALAQLDNSNGGTILTNNNIKTINGNSIFGTGDIVISGGGGGGGNYLPLAGGTLTGLLGINTNGNTVTIGSQNNEWCHFYNSANVPFIFNKDVWTIGGLMPYDGSTYDIGSASRRWSKIYAKRGDFSNTAGWALHAFTNHANGFASFFAAEEGYGMWCGISSTSSSKYIANFRNNIVDDGSGGNSVFYIRGDGNIGIGTESPSCKLHVSGDIYATGDVTAASDERQKCDIEQINLSVEQIANAPAIKFSWKDGRDNLRHVGSFAQYWQKILPESVSDKNDVLGLNYGGAVMVGLVSVAKEVVSQDKRNNEQDEQIRLQNEQIKQLKQRVWDLENEVKRLKSA